jgi:isopentenyldiphosphate isomerase
MDEQIGEQLEKQPKPGRIDYHNIRYVPIVNAVVVKDGALLLIQRSDRMHFYPECWDGITGYLDGDISIEDKALEQVNTELGLRREDILSMQRGKTVVLEAPEYHKTWLTIPVLVTAKIEDFHLDWSSKKARWCSPKEIGEFRLVPHFDKIIEQFASKISQD